MKSSGIRAVLISLTTILAAGCGESDSDSGYTTPSGGRVSAGGTTSQGGQAGSGGNSGAGLGPGTGGSSVAGSTAGGNPGGGGLHSTGGSGAAGGMDAGGTTAGGSGGGSGGEPSNPKADAIYEGVIGFAKIDGAGNQSLPGGVTGGKGGKIVRPKTAEEFIEFVKAPEPLIVVVDGSLTLPINDVEDGKGGIKGGYLVSSNKSIVGKGSSAKLVGGGLLIGKLPFLDEVTTPPADAIGNVIIRNITFDGEGGVANNTDGVNIYMHSHHVWVDHCTFTNQADGALDVKRGSSYVTVSWNHFKGVNKTSLVGHADGGAAKAQDTGYLKSTFHHNFFDGTGQRHPRVRFGEVHALNNYLRGTGEGMGCGEDSKIYAENTFATGNATYNKGGAWQDVGCKYNGTEVSPSNVGWKPSDYYQYTADPVDSVPEMVPAGAGVGKIDFDL